ncbi:single-stranded DNA-binding protein [Verrucomicrobiota bacterium]
MTGFNRVVLVGNLTRDPQLRQTPSGTAVADIGLAASERYRNKQGEQVEKTCFVDIVAWGRQAECCSEFLSKGSAVLVEGRLQYDRWETDDGQKRSKIRVRADHVAFLGRPRREGSEEAEKEQDDPLPF